MTDVVGRGTIELVGDARKLKASIEDAKKSIRTLGEGQREITKRAQRSIDRYIGRLQVQNATLGKTARETELYKLALRGASNEQLKTADAALRLTEVNAKTAESVKALKTGFIALGAAAVTGLIAAAAAFDHFAKQGGKFQDLAEKIGDTAENVASLAVSAAVGGVQMDAVAAASIRLTKALTDTNDESTEAGAAIKALGLDLQDFKKLSPADQFDAVAKALARFEDGSAKTAVTVALLGKAGADMLPFLKELGTETGRQVILTSEQIRLADEYSDRQARLRAEIGLYAQAIVADMLPALNEFTSTIAELARDQEFAATASDILKGSLSAAVVVLQTIAVVGANVGFVFLSVGREIGAIAAQLNALAHLDFAGFTAISDAVKEDGVRARAELDRFEAKILSIGQGAQAAAGETGPKPKSKPTLKFSGASKATEEAKAQLAFDLEQIRKASEATIGAFANAEKILQARRAANLIVDREYYAAKLGFINLNNQAQEAALGKEIERLQQEKLIGKERIDNDRKIVEAQAKLAKVRADAVANIEVHSIQEAAANQKLAQSYVDAKIAADAYIASIVRRNQQEIEGIGRGAKFREVQAGRNQIEDKFNAQRQALERDRRNNLITQETFDTYLAAARDTYAKEIALYDERTRVLVQKEGDWVNGATEALQNYYDASRDIAKQTEELFTSAFKSMEDALVDFVRTGKLDFKSLANSIISDLIRIQVRKDLGQIAGALGGGGGLIAGIGALFGGGSSVTPLADAAASSGIISSFAAGTDFVPRTGIALLHEGEAVIPAEQNKGGRGMNFTLIQNFPNGTSRAAANQAAAAAGEAVQRAMARNT